MNHLYEIVKITGVGVKECPYVEHSTGLIFKNKLEAEKEAERLLKEQTTEEERKGGWRDLNYIVKQRNVK